MGKLVNKKGKVDLSRPVTNLTGVDRKWSNIAADDLEAGDTVAGTGLVQTKNYSTNPFQVMLTVGLAPDIRDAFFDPETIVLAFVRKDS